MLAATKVKLRGSEKSELEHLQHFLHKTCKQEVSCCREKRNVQKKCYAPPNVFFVFVLFVSQVFLPFSLPSPFSIALFNFLFE